MYLKTQFFLCVFVASVALYADHFGGFLENIDDELQMLNLSKEQEVALKGIIKNHHKFLRQWYSDSLANSEKMMKNFADSTLKNNTPDIARDKSLAIDKIDAEHRFMMSVYEILDANQRRIFSAKIKAKNKENKKLNKDRGFVKYRE